MNTHSLTILTEPLGWALLHSLWQGALVAGALALVLPLLRHPAARHAACLLALLVLAAAFSVTAVHHYTPSAPAAAWSPAVDARETDAPIATAAPANVPRATSAGHRLTWRERGESMLAALSAAWLLGIALLLLRHGLGWRRVRALRRQGVDARPELQRTFLRLLEKYGRTGGVRLLETAHVSSPMLVGLLRPAVLLPVRVVTGLRDFEIEAILAHELAHLVRRDAWSHLVQVAIETLLFYHPAVWWIGRRARQEREYAADDLALTLCADRRSYAGALAHVAEFGAAPQVALAATGGHLLARIQRILRAGEVETASSGWSIGLPVLAAAALAILASFRADAEPATPAMQGPARSEALAKPWIADAFQLDDAAKREAAIERIRAAMRSADADEARAGISAFRRIAAVEFDKPSCRPEVRALLGSADGPTRAAAVDAIAIIGGEPGDVERILALADDPAEEVRAGLASAIMRLKKNDLRDQAASDAILKLMAKLPRDSRSVAHSLWGAKLSPAIESRVLEFTRDMDRASNGDVGYHFFYGALSTQANKSEASVRRLIELLAHQDTTNIAGRAAWGLRRGVDRAQHGLVADAMLKVIEARSEGDLRSQALGCLRDYGSAAQVLPLKGLLDKPGVGGGLSDGLTGLLFVQEKDAGPERTTPAASGHPQATSPSTEKAEIEVEWQGRWWPARILKRDGERAFIHYVGYGAEWDEWAPAARMRLISAAGEARAEVEKNKQAARERAARDREHYTVTQMQEIEALYQVANKNWRTPEARESLKKLLEKYDRSNRTGCATLYMGQMSEGQERLDYLTRAVEKFSDCYYLDGCQVGGFGRYVLAIALWDSGEKAKARARLDELKTQYADATDHRGQTMRATAAALETQWAAGK